MTGLSALWLPILLSAIVVFFASSLIHMLLKWHDSDYRALPNEDGFRAAVHPLAIPPGDYVTPRAGSTAEMRSPEFNEKMKTGPVMMLTVMPNGPISMGKSLSLWFVFIVVVSIFAAYITGRALPPGADYMEVFRFISTTAFIGYSLALWQMSIWFRRAWGTTIKATVDGLIYALLTAGVFGWLWPG
jgi:hypothetical protein